MCLGDIGWNMTAILSTRNILKLKVFSNYFPHCDVDYLFGLIIF